MENFLRSKEYWNVVEFGVAEPATGATEAQKTEFEALKLKDLKAKNYLFQSINRSILESILCKETSKQIWDSMKKKYQGNVKARRVQLQGVGGEEAIVEVINSIISRMIINFKEEEGDMEDMTQQLRDQSQ